MDTQSEAESKLGKQKLQPLKGFRDFLPEEAKKRQFVINKIKKTFELYGFEPLETPALEYQEVLLGKYGSEANKLLYSFTDAGGRAVALRYDQTVPTARILAMYKDNLPQPFRRYQIQNAWRAENPQFGRYREFLQCDADIYGSYSSLADAEILALCHGLYKNLGFSNFKIYINDRNILYELMNYASIPDSQHFSTISEIDKLDRKSKEEIKSELKNKGLTESSIEHLFHHMDEAVPTDNLKSIINYAKTLGVEEDKLVFQARLARGLDYYTSTIFEVKIDNYQGGSVLGGGRYDNLIGNLSGIQMPAVGFAVGFDRTLEAMEQLNLIKDYRLENVLITIFNKDLSEFSSKVAQKLRDFGISTELYPDETKDLTKQLKYADKKKIKWLIVVGPQEAEKESVILKDLVTGHQEEIKLDNIVKKLTS